jgi:hypothetical protein
VWVAVGLDPQERQEIIAHEATHVVLYAKGWAYTQTPATGSDAQMIQRIGALLVNAVQHPEIERRLRVARIDARPGHRAKALRRVRDLQSFARELTRLELVHEALFQLDNAFVPDRDLREKADAALRARIPAAAALFLHAPSALGYTFPRSMSGDAATANRFESAIPVA